MNIILQNITNIVLYLLNTIVCYFQSMYTLVLFFDFFLFHLLLNLTLCTCGFNVFCQALWGKNKFNAYQFSQNWFWNKQTYIGLLYFIKLSLQKKTKYFLWKVVQRTLCSVVLKIPRYYHKQLHEHTTGIHAWYKCYG